MGVSNENKYLSHDGLSTVWAKVKEYTDDKAKKLVNVTYSELVDMRDSNMLFPGRKYRITDYETTTSQAGTTSANHPFDIIVTALDESTLSENASAIKSARDTDNYFGTENLEAWQLKYCLDNDTDRFAWADNSTPPKAEFVALFWDDPVNGINYDKHIGSDKIYDWGTAYDPETEIDNIVIYKSDVDIYRSEGSADYSDQYFYRGIVEVDGEEYDSWKKFETGDGDWVTNDEGQYQYALTERIVFDGQVIWPELKPEIIRIYDSSNCVIKNEYDNGPDDSGYNALSEYIEIAAIMMDDPVNGDSYESLDKDIFSHYGYETEPNGGNSLYLLGRMLEDGDDLGLCEEQRYYYRGIVSVGGSDFDCWQKCDVDNEEYELGEGETHKYYFLTNKIVDGEVTFTETEKVYGGKGVIYNMIDEYGNECPYDFKNIKFYYEGLGTDVYTFTWIDDSYNVMDTSIFGNNGILTCHGNIYGVYGNVIKQRKVRDNSKTKQLLNNITFISDYEYDYNGNEGFCGCYNNSFGNDCHNNSFGNGCNNNAFSSDCYNNSFGDGCYNNRFGNGCNNNAFSSDCYGNSFGNGCYSNSLSGNCHYNSFGNGCYGNKFSSNGSGNSFGNGCYSNSLSGNCHYNSFGNFCHDNSLSNSCYYNSFGNGCYGNKFSSNCSDNLLGNSCDNNNFGKNCKNNSLGNDSYQNILDEYCCENSFGEYCYENKLMPGCYLNSFGNRCWANTLSNSSTGNSFGTACGGNNLGLSCHYNSFGNYCSFNKFCDRCKCNSFGNDCNSNSFGNDCCNNSFENKCCDNSFGNDCCNNSFGNNCKENSFGYNCFYNLLGNSCNSNSFGNYCEDNSLDNNCSNNIFGDTCTYNSFGEDCYSNSFGDNCVSNSFENACDTNSLGNGCRDNSFSNRCNNNSLSNACYSNSFGNSCISNSFGDECENNSFGNSCIFNSFGNYFINNSFGNDCEYNNFGNSCIANSFGNSCIFNSFRLSALTTGDLLDYCCYNHFDDGCSYNVIWNNVQPTDLNVLQNINIVRGVSGKSSAYNFINMVDKNSDYEIKVAKNSNGDIKVYCEADLIK